MRRHKLIDIDWPDFGVGDIPPQASADEFSARIDETRSTMERRGITHMVIYADREHFANLAYLTGFDPRFEESILILGLSGKPLILVGNECEGYLPISPLIGENQLRHERFQPFSLLDQPRDSSRLLKDIFFEENIDNKSVIGCVGWKYFSESEHPEAKYAIDLPSFIVDTLRELAGREHVMNATDLFMHPAYGLRTNCSASEIAFFEYSNTISSEGMKRMLFGMKEGMVDFEVMSLAHFNGLPLGCHPTFATGKKSQLGLNGPTGERIVSGKPLSTNVCYWGSNICRAGWIAASDEDLPEVAKDYVENFAGKYFEVLAEWLRILKIGALGGDFYRLVQEQLPFEKFGIFLNPGHLIHMDEWVSAPMYRDSLIPIRSGMVIQVDVIPSSPVYFSTRMEDGVVIADHSLQLEIRQSYPKCYERCMRRREFMHNVLNLELPGEMLPLSNTAGIVPPYFLNANRIFALEP